MPMYGFPTSPSTPTQSVGSQLPTSPWDYWGSGPGNPNTPGNDPFPDEFEDVPLNDPPVDPGRGPTVTETEAEQLGRVNTAQHTLQQATNLHQDAIDTLNMVLRGLSGAVQAFYAAVIIAGGAATTAGASRLLSAMQSNDPAPWMHQYQYWFTSGGAPINSSDLLGPPGNQRPTPTPPNPTPPTPTPPGGPRPPRPQPPGSQGASFRPATTDTVSLSLLALLGAVTALVSGVTAKLAHSHCHVEIDDGPCNELPGSSPKGEEQ